MLGLSRRIPKMYFLEVSLNKDAIRYNLPDVEFLRDKTILFVEFISGNANGYTTPSGSVPYIDSNNIFDITLCDTHNKVRVSKLPLNSATNNLFLSGFQLNTALKLSMCHLDIDSSLLTEPIKNGLVGKSIQLVIHYADSPQGSKCMGFISESEKIIVKSKVEKKLTNLNNLDSTYKIISFCTQSFTNVFAKIVNTRGVTIYENIPLTALAGCIIGNNSINEVHKLEPIQIDFSKSIIQHSFNVDTPIFLGAFYEFENK